MDCYCELCLKNITAKNKYKCFKSKCQIEFDKCKHIILSNNDIDINDIDKCVFLYIIEHYKFSIIVLQNVNLKYFLKIMIFVHM